MLYFRRSRFLRCVMLPLALVAFLSACTSWKYETVEHPAPYESLALGEPDKVTVTLDDGRRVDLRHPFIRADSLIGTVYDERNRAYTDTVGVALAEVSSVEQRKMKSSAKTLTIVAIVIAIPAMIGVIALSEGR